MELMLAISARLVASVGLSNSAPGSVYRAMGNSYHIKRETCLQTIRNVFVHVHNYKVLVAKTSRKHICSVVNQYCKSQSLYIICIKPLTIVKYTSYISTAQCYRMCNTSATHLAPVITMLQLINTYSCIPTAQWKCYCNTRTISPSFWRHSGSSVFEQVTKVFQKLIVVVNLEVVAIVFGVS